MAADAPSVQYAVQVGQSPRDAVVGKRQSFMAEIKKVQGAL